MRIASLVLLLGCAMPAPAAEFWVYFGCYTGSKPGDSTGISRSLLNTETGALSKPETVAAMTNPSFLAIRPDRTALYTVGEVGRDDTKTQGLTAFALDAKTGTLAKKNGLPSGGAGPCHVAVSPDGKTAVVANYGGGSCAFYSIADDGSLAKQIAFFQHTGDLGPNKARQDKPHGHCGKFSSDGKKAYVCDLGLDCVNEFDVAGATVMPLASWKLPPGSGPRHIALWEKDGVAFVNGELDSTLNVVRIQDGKVVQSISTLPGGKAVAGNTTAEVVVHPNGKFVYGSNRGHNSIAAFSWDGSKLTAIGHATAGIKVPRNFNIAPGGKFMLVANQDGNDVHVFSLGDDGVPKPTGTTVAVGKPVCVLFVPKE